MQTVAHFVRRAEEELQRLHEQLRDGTYRRQPVRRAWIPKSGRKAVPSPLALRAESRWVQAPPAATASCQARCGTFWNKAEPCPT